MLLGGAGIKMFIIMTPTAFYVLHYNWMVGCIYRPMMNELVFRTITPFVFSLFCKPLFDLTQWLSLSGEELSPIRYLI